MSKQPNKNDVLFSLRNEEALTRQQRLPNKEVYYNQQNYRKINGNQVYGVMNENNQIMNGERDQQINKYNYNENAQDNINKQQNLKQQNFQKAKSVLIDKEQIDDENARGFDYIFPLNSSKYVPQNYKDYENSLTSCGDSKYQMQSDQSSLYSSTNNQNNNLRISNINNKSQHLKPYHNQFSNNIHRDQDYKSSKVAKFGNQFEKDIQQASGQQYQQQQHGFLSTNSSINLQNLNSNNLLYGNSSSINNASQFNSNKQLENTDSLFKKEQSNLDIQFSHNINGQYSQDQMQRISINYLSNNNFNNELVGEGNYGCLNSINNFNLINNNNNNLNNTFNHIKHENTNSNGQVQFNLPKTDDIFDDDGVNTGLTSLWLQVKEENEDCNTIFGKQASANHQKNIFSSSLPNQNIIIQNTNNILKKQQQFFTASNAQEQTNPIDQHRIQNDDSNNNFDPDGDQNKSLRGLRILSHKVKQIVQEKGLTTYKEVAETLVQNLKNGQKQQNNQEELRDEQNIKRRVYDALNVLIASEVITKKGKKVLANTKTNLTGKCLQAHNWKEAKDQQGILDKKIEKVNQKKYLLQEYSKKYIALNNLIERNKNEERYQTQRNSQFFDNCINRLEDYDDNERFLLNSQFSNRQTQNPKDNVLQTQLLQINKFNFPLLAISFNPDEQSRVILKMNQEKSNLKIYAKGYLETLGDLDILCKMNLDQVSEAFKHQVLGSEYMNWYNSLSQIKKSERSQIQYDKDEQQQQFILKGVNNF